MTAMQYTTRKDLPAQLPTVWTKYCYGCHAEGPEATTTKTGQRMYHCTDCKQTYERYLTYDPKMISHFDTDDRLVHESCGVIPVRSDGKLLLYQRIKFPFLLTIPAGHMEVGEVPIECAAREMEEEIGIRPDKLVTAFEGTIVGDSCVGGADVHVWHAYVEVVDNHAQPVMDGVEGVEWGWHDTTELNTDNTVQPLLMLLNEVSVQRCLSAIG